MNHIFLPLVVKQWSAWSPHLHNHDDWLSWARATPMAMQPALDETQVMAARDTIRRTLPLPLRRHTSPTTQMVLATCAPLVTKQPIDYVLFCSQHGELQRSMQLLNDIATQTLLSPADFTHSVHNIAVGLLAIWQYLTVNTQSIAAGAQTFMMGMIDAMAWLQLHPGKTVLLAMYDDVIPVPYQSLVYTPHAPYVLALLLTTGTKDTASCLLPQLTSTTPKMASLLPPALTFLAWLLQTSQQPLTQPCYGQSLIWHRHR